MNKLFFAGIYFVVMVFSIRAAVSTVTTVDDSGAGSFFEAINKANDGDTIKFSLSFPDTIFLSKEALIGKSLTIDGALPFARRERVVLKALSYQETAQNPSAKFRIMKITAGTVNVANINLVAGKALDGLPKAAAGGALLITGSDTKVNLRKVDICKSQAFYSGLPARTYGGAVYVDSTASLLLDSCTLTENKSYSLNESFDSTVAYGGAIFNAGTLVMVNCTLYGNSACAYSESSTQRSFAVYGGGIFNKGAAIISFSTLKSNSASAYGSAAIVGNTYSNAFGGGIYNGKKGTCTITNASISKNTSSTSFSANPSYNYYTSKSYGGGIYNADSASVSVSATTLDSNSASASSPQSTASYGGAIYNGAATTTAMLLANVTIFNNSCYAGYGSFTSVSKTSQGGAIYNSRGTLIIINGTVVNNGSANYYQIASYDSLHLLNNIIISSADTHNLQASGAFTAYYNVIGPAPANFLAVAGDTVWSGTNVVNRTFREVYSDSAVKFLYNGGFGKTLALSENSIAAGSGVKTAYLVNGKPFGVFAIGSQWYCRGKELSVDEPRVEITGDQRGVAIDSPYCSGAFWVRKIAAGSLKGLRTLKPTSCQAVYNAALSRMEFFIDGGAPLSITLRFFDLRGRFFYTQRKIFTRGFHYVTTDKIRFQGVMIGVLSVDGSEKTEKFVIHHF